MSLQIFPEEILSNALWKICTVKNPISKKYKTEVSEYAEYYRGYPEVTTTNRGLASKVRYYRGAEDNYGFNTE